MKLCLLGIGFSAFGSLEHRGQEAAVRCLGADPREGTSVDDDEDPPTLRFVRSQPGSAQNPS